MRPSAALVLAPINADQVAEIDRECLDTLRPRGILQLFMESTVMHAVGGIETFALG